MEPSCGSGPGGFQIDKEFLQQLAKDGQTTVERLCVECFVLFLWPITKAVPARALPSPRSLSQRLLLLHLHLLVLFGCEARGHAGVVVFCCLLFHLLLVPSLFLVRRWFPLTAGLVQVWVDDHFSVASFVHNPTAHLLPGTSNTSVSRSLKTDERLVFVCHSSTTTTTSLQRLQHKLNIRSSMREDLLQACCIRLH